MAANLEHSIFVRVRVRVTVRIKVSVRVRVRSRVDLSSAVGLERAPLGTDDVPGEILYHLRGRGLGRGLRMS